MTDLYGVGILIKELTLSTDQVVKVSSMDKGIVGFVPIYESEKAAKKAYKGFQIIPIDYGQEGK